MLQRLPLPLKLALLGFFPLLFLVILTLQVNNEKTEKLAMLNGYRDRIRAAIRINELIDALQTERRYTFGYALKGAWQSDMLHQRALTDSTIEHLLRLSGQNYPELASYTFLDRLRATRIQVDKKAMPAMDVMNFYTNAVFRLSTLNQVAAGYNVYLAPVLKDLAGQKILADILTYEGIVRSQIYLMLDTRQPNPQIITSVNQLREIINTYIREFHVKASPEAIRSFRMLQGDADVKAMNAYLQTIRSTYALDTTMNAETWWEISANAVDRMRNLQQEMINRVSSGVDRIYMEERNRQYWTLGIIVVLFALVILLSLAVARSISRTLSSLREASHALARGQTGVSIPEGGRDVVGSLVRSLRAIDQSNRQLAGAAEAIGKGRFDVAVEPRSREDVLGNALVQMKTNLEVLTRTSEEKLWLQTGAAEVNEALRGEKDLAALTHDVLLALALRLGCQTGLLYVARDGMLHREAGYAISSEEKVPRTLRFGETLIGQVAQTGKPCLLESVPDEFLQIRSASGAAMPRHVLIAPLMANNQVEGVVEVAALNRFTGQQQALLDEVAEAVAIALQMAKSRQRLQELLEETQAQSEELQSQHGELEGLNAELEMQAQRLQASEEELKVQQEELMQANGELEARSRKLEERNQLILERNLEIQRKAEELELSTRYKSEFLANMSHELRT
ncbi:MAG TPA: nitrate- and nitrite sensing domain-containing protein, partial [Chitinophagaceae bacterium]|nr:nitrate- and nitrite sensing domain-containing protein [Chitinophagaceae bacterium]